MSLFASRYFSLNLILFAHVYMLFCFFQGILLGFLVDRIYQLPYNTKETVLRNRKSLNVEQEASPHK